MLDQRWTSRLLILLVIATAVWLAEQVMPLLHTFADIIFLFFLAWLVAFILAPVADGLERLRVRRSLAVVAIYAVLAVALALLVLVFGPVLAAQFMTMAEAVPAVVALVPTADDLSQVLTRLGLPAGALSTIYRPEVVGQQVQAAAAMVLQSALALATRAVVWIVNGLLVFIISFYLLLDGRRMVRAAVQLTPHQYRAQVLQVLAQTSASFGGFLRGQIIQAVLFGLVVAVVMALSRLDFVFAIVLASALLMLIPVIGPTLALVPPLVIAAIEAPADFVVVLIVLVAIQLVIINVLMPRILGEQMGMHPLLVFAAILLGLRIGGPAGAFFGIPIMGVIWGLVSAAIMSWRSATESASVAVAEGSGVSRE